MPILVLTETGDHKAGHQRSPMAAYYCVVRYACSSQSIMNHGPAKTWHDQSHANHVSCSPNVLTCLRCLDAKHTKSIMACSRAPETARKVACARQPRPRARVDTSVVISNSSRSTIEPNVNNSSSTNGTVIRASQMSGAQENHPAGEMLK